MTPDTYTISEKMLDVGDGHTLYVHDWGNPNAAQTIVFLHGGPGVGCSDSHKAFFDGTRDHVIFFDQRGSGKSLPAGRLEANTTDHLVEDIKTILKQFNLQSVVLFGGSWGSFLALAYALKYPADVKAMVLRGIFTGRQSEIDHIDKGAFRAFYPEVWDAFVKRTPSEHQHDPASYHGPRAIGTDQAAAKESAYAYSELESSIMCLDDRRQAEDFSTFKPEATQIEVHYLVNHCFVDNDYIMKHASQLRMPVWLVQGRYDMVCPPITAYELHQVLPNCKLTITVSGHAGSERGNFDALRSIVAAVNS